MNDGSAIIRDSEQLGSQSSPRNIQKTCKVRFKIVNCKP